MSTYENVIAFFAVYLDRAETLARDHTAQSTWETWVFEISSRRDGQVVLMLHNTWEPDFVDAITAECEKRSQSGQVDVNAGTYSRELSYTPK